MEQIKTVSLSRLRIDAHCVYMTHTYERITASTDAVKTILGSLPSKFEDKLKIEKSIMDTQKCSPVTKELQDADRRQDKALSALRILVRGQKYNQNIYNADAADHVYEMLMEYGNINSKRYESQVGDIESILRKLAGEYSSEVTTLLQYAPSISTEITELKTANAAFKAALEKRGDYNKNKPDKTFHQIKKEIEPIYHEIAAIINANALVNTDPGFEKIITR
ncbi:MAG: DUF6261 family protein, partial [Dysgonamonadaceae bacterium]|nr:DUF6261 family protein [Dysgonamonadaceae bacterium]